MMQGEHGELPIEAAHEVDSIDSIARSAFSEPRFTLMASPDPSPIVAWKDVRKVFPGGHEALRGVSLDVRSGECLAILGTSGSGKTTLLKTVNRLIEPTSGTVFVEGRAAADWDPITLRRSIGYVIQEVGLMPHMNVLANVALVPKLRGAPRREREERARLCLELVGLKPDRFERLMPHEVSGGQRQRVGVARALAADPAIIIMDEPFGALDPVTRREIQNEFRALQRRLKKTVVIVTHDLREACRIADRLALMEHGLLVQQGKFRDFRDYPESQFVREFFRDAEAIDEEVAE
jgi:osmoprotectant transport system ATP-binding protein